MFANAIAYGDTAPPAGAPIISDPKLVAGGLDPFQRPQIHDTRVGPTNRGPIWRQGAWEVDGDPSDAVGEGFVSYGANALGNGPDATQGGYFFATPYSFGRYQIVPGVNGGNTFLVCGFEDGSVNAPFGYNAFLVVDNNNDIQFQVDRATGITTVGSVGAPGVFDLVQAAQQFVQIGTSDPFARQQIWSTLLNSVLRLGADTSDGDAFSADSEGIVVYHPSDDTLGRMKADRFGLTRASNSALYYFRVDGSSLFVKDVATSLLNLFTVDQATLNTLIGDPANPVSKLFVNQSVTDHGSSADVQVSSLTPNAPQLRCNQYGNNAGIPGLSTIKSRGAAIGSLVSVNPGDVLLRLTAVGVPADNTSIPLAGLVSINVPAGGVGLNYVATDFEVQLVPLTGPINGRKQAFLVDSEGILHVKEAGPAGAPTSHMAGLAVTGAGGTVVVPSVNVKATTKFTLTIQDGGAAPTNGLYVSARVVGASFTIQMINPADVGVQVYYQLWEPTIP